MKTAIQPLYWTRWLLAGTVIAAFPSAASAHFVWVEPAPSMPGAAQVYFGEYPTVRESAPLLDKVQGVKLFALDGKSRRELKQVRGENHFRYDGIETAPVVAGSLDYGILQRGESPAYFLRYETVLLRGNGKPLPATELSRLSQVKTDLPLSFTLQPSGAGLQLTSLLHGKPVAAEVSVGNPGDQELKKTRTSDSGTLELPLSATGWYHLRLSAEDGKPVTFQGKEGKFTRTYLSVMFQAEKPDGTPAATAAVKTDADAIKILKDAHEARAHWGADFPGFTADAVYMWNGKQVKGTITVDSQLNIKYDLGDKEAETSLRPSFGSLIMHRGGGDGTPDYPASWKDAEVHPLGRAINLNDKYGSWYRVKDRQILQVNRNMGSQRFTTNVLENESGRHGFLPRAWTVSYYDNSTNALLRSSTTHVTWKWLGEVFVPAIVQTVNAHNEGTEVTGLVLTNQRLLK